MSDIKPHLFQSKFRAFRVSIRPERLQMHPVTGQIISELPRMVAEFGLHGEEFEAEDETGRLTRFGDIRGFFYDLDVDAEEKGWSDEEKEAARERLLRLCKTWPESIWVVEPVKLEAPWPTYDKMPAGQIAPFAREAGRLVEARDYEVANKNRKTVIEQIDALLADERVEEELVSA